MLKLAEYAALSPNPPANSLCRGVNLPQYSRGLGAIGLPGDFSSSSRFVRAVFLKNYTLMPSESLAEKGNDASARDRIFHIMSGISVPLGCVMTAEGKPVCTLYTSVCDLDSLTYHYFTYADRTVKSISL